MHANEHTHTHLAHTPMHVYTHLTLPMHAHIPVRTLLCTHTHACACIHPPVYACTHMRTHLCMQYTCSCVNARMRAHSHTHTPLPFTSQKPQQIQNKHKSGVGSQNLLTAGVTYPAPFQKKGEWSQGEGTHLGKKTLVLSTPVKEPCGVGTGSRELGGCTRLVITGLLSPLMQLPCLLPPPESPILTTKPH